VAFAGVFCGVHIGGRLGVGVAVMNCQLHLSPDCEQTAEVQMRTLAIEAATCLPCGKAFQAKFPHVIDSLSIRAIPDDQPAQLN